MYLSYYTFKLSMPVARLMDALYTHARLDDLDLDAKSQWVGKAKQYALHGLGNLYISKPRILNLLQRYVIFYVTLTLTSVANVYVV